MRKPARIVDIVLGPGEFYFGGKESRIRTTLGSCVSIVMWHEDRLLGGMCHYLLPNRSSPRPETPDGRYADEAIELFMREIQAANTKLKEYQVKIFGGGNMFPRYKNWGKYQNVPCKNVLAARELVKRYALNVKGENLGGTGHRQVIFDVWNGHVWMRRAEINSANSET